MDKVKFDYAKAVAELDGIVAKAEDPTTGIDDIDVLLKRSAELIRDCRAYLRTAREEADRIMDAQMHN